MKYIVARNQKPGKGYFDLYPAFCVEFLYDAYPVRGKAFVSHDNTIQTEVFILDRSIFAVIGGDAR